MTEDGHREERTLTSDPEILAAYRRYFGITLDRVPVINGRPPAGTHMRERDSQRMGSSDCP